MYVPCSTSVKTKISPKLKNPDLCLSPRVTGDMDEFPFTRCMSGIFPLPFLFSIFQFLLAPHSPFASHDSSAPQPSSARESPHPPGEVSCRGPLAGENNPLV